MLQNKINKEKWVIAYKSNVLIIVGLLIIRVAINMRLFILTQLILN